MKHQKWLMLLIALALMAGTVGALTRLRASQKLGKPGVKATPIPGSVMMKIDLPERVLDFSSSNMPEPEVVLGYLPKDTSYVERYYWAPDGFWATGTIILMGADRTSIHRPDYCLPGQGWTIDAKTAVTIPIGGAQPYELPAFKWTIHNTFQTPDGQKQEVSGVYVFWFVADNEVTPNYVRFQYYLLRDLLFTARLQRWAYISYYTVCAPGQEEAAFARLEKLIAASVPEYQPPPVKR
ncbi:MAG: exosortase-associated EpsI family protein [Verrucomicrobiia bacterium]